MRTRLCILILASGFSISHADTVSEVESNDTKAAAQPITLNCGDVLTGATTGADAAPAGALATADYFLLTSGLPAGGLHRYRLNFPASAHDLSLRGRNFTIPGSDLALQSAFLRADDTRYLTWYGVGGSAGDRIYARIAGTPQTTAPYAGTFECTPISPVLAAHVIPRGPFQVSASTGVKLALFSPNLDLLAGGDSGSISFDATPGAYLVATAPAPIATSGTNGPRTDLGGVLVTSHSAANAAGEIHITNTRLSTVVGVDWAEPNDIAWVRFYVSDSGAGACCLGASCTPSITSAECTAHGGRFLGGAVPCVQELCPQACCFGDGYCSFTNAPDCTARGGSVQAAGSTCATATCPALYAAGCANPVILTVPQQLPYTDTRTTCGLLPNQSCSYLGEDAVYQIDVTAPACLRVVVQSVAAAHVSLGTGCPQCPSEVNSGVLDPVFVTPGTYWLSVRTNPCAAYTLTLDDCPIRGCCFSDGSCQELLPAACAQMGGSTAAVGSTCATAACPPARTCCLATESCVQITAAACTAMGGRVFSEQSTCAPNFCDDMRVCCVPSVGCETLTVSACLLRGGDAQPPGAGCPGNCLAGCIRGDANCDGAVNGFDIDSFVLVIVNNSSPQPPAGWQVSAGCWQLRSCTCDVDHSGRADNFDIDPFVVCRISGYSPCP